jgi:dihydroneopterin aldolase/2-amino-4-hydroxy-6-hydroxymethyldihydropteridine diphosphokinase
MSDCVAIDGLRAYGYHGRLPHEKERGQWFVVDVRARLDLRGAGRDNDIDQTVDYGSMAREVRTIVESERFDLIEAVAERVAAAILARPAVESVTVRVSKPCPPTNVDVTSVWVEIERSR